MSALDYHEHVARRHRTILSHAFYEPLELAALDARADGFMYPHQAAEAMGVSEAEILRLARQGALDVRGEYVRPALVGWVAVRA